MCSDAGSKCVEVFRDFESPERMYHAVWSWVEKILDGTVSPHFMFIISKIDEIEEGFRDDKVRSLIQDLTALLKKHKFWLSNSTH